MKQQITQNLAELEPVQTGGAEGIDGLWTERLVLFLRVMAALSMLKGLYHWSILCGIGEGRDTSFEAHTLVWQTATVFFAVIDLIAAVGLWLAAAWGAVVWLTSMISLVAAELLFPQVYGGRLLLLPLNVALLGAYLFLALRAARERPP